RRHSGVARLCGSNPGVTSQRLLDNAADHVRGDGAQGPTQVTVAGVVEHAWRFAAPDLGHHVRHHRRLACPGYYAVGVDAGAALVDPLHPRADTVGAKVAVVDIELGGAGDPAAITGQAAADQFGLVVEQAAVGRRRAAEFVGKVDGDG